MARKKTTKSADPAPEYIDSAGVKLNAASDLIIEANKSGDVISARNLINGKEYVGGGSGAELFYPVNLYTEDYENFTSDKNFEQIVTNLEKIFIFIIHQEGSLNSSIILNRAGYTIDEGTGNINQVYFTGETLISVGGPISSAEYSSIGITFTEAGVDVSFNAYLVSVTLD